MLSRDAPQTLATSRIATASPLENQHQLFNNDHLQFAIWQYIYSIYIVYMLCFQYFPVRFFRMSHDVNNKHPPASRRFGSSRNWAFAQLGVGLSDITPATTLETFFSVIIAFRRATDFFSGLTDGSYGGLIWWLFFYDMGMTWEFSTFSFHDWSSKVYPLYIVYPYIQGDVFLIPKFPPTSTS